MKSFILLLLHLTLTLAQSPCSSETVCRNVTAEICPINFSLTPDNRCNPPETVCPDLFEWNGVTCLYVEQVCPANFYFDGSECQVRQKTCPEGYSWNGNFCQQPYAECQDGLELVDGSCLDTNPTCPPGDFRWNGSVCVRVEVVCPQNFVLRGEICVQERVQCPNQHHLEGERCVRDDPECPDADQSWDGTQCVSLLVCPPAYELKDNACVRRVLECPPEFDFVVDQCVPRTVCERNFTLVDGRCVLVERVCETRNQTCAPTPSCPPTTTCSNGFEWQNGRCVCLPGRILPNGTCVNTVCPPGSVFRNGRCEAVEKQRCPLGYDWKDGRCVLASTFCLPGWVWVGGRCQKNCSVLDCGVLTCPEGTVLENGLCVQLSCGRKNVSTSCPPGFVFQNGACLPLVVCPPGYYNSGNYCIPLNTSIGSEVTTTETTGGSQNASSIPEYGTGITSEVSPGVTVPATTDQGCATHPPIVQCPNGYDPDGTTCVPRCPPGYKNTNGVCQLVCPEGFVPSNGGCVPRVCPEGFNLVNGNCVPAVCPRGFTLVNGVCVPSPVSCPVNHVLVNGVCVPIRCPDGYYVQSGTCVPLPTQCPDGFSRLPGGGCIEASKCANGFVNVNGECVLDQCGRGFFRGPDGRCVPILQCPPHTYFHNGSCVHFGCPEGFYYENEECHPVRQEKLERGKGPRGDFGETHVTNHNVVDHPINITNVNINTIGIYLGSCRDGRVRAVIVRENGTETLSCGDEEAAQEEEILTQEGEEATEGPRKCCTVVSPRKCEKQGDEWICYNRKRQLCGGFCSAETVYLSPSRRDCNACLGGGYRCVTECFKAPPCGEGSCHYIDYDHFCSTVSSEIC